MSQSESIVRLTSVSKLYEAGRERSAGVHEITCESRRGEMVLFLGPSGSGKTTLLTLAAGLLAPTSGRVDLFGQDIRRLSASALQRLRALHVGFVFQTFRLIDALTVEENVQFVRNLARAYGHPGTANGVDLLERFSIGHLRKALPPTLSQGEKQRLAIARALANNPELIIADEPTASLSTDDCMTVIQILHEAASVHSRCVLVATHDTRLVGCADRVIYLRDGRLLATKVGTGGTERLTGISPAAA